jgi:hypothetical protein
VYPLQAGVQELATGTPLAFLGTLLVSWALFAYAAQVAATFFLGDVPWRRAALVGVVPAVVNVALVRWSVPVIVAVALLADFAAIRTVYRLRYRTAALVTVMHAVVAIVLGIGIVYLFRLLGTAPV